MYVCVYAAIKPNSSYKYHVRINMAAILLRIHFVWSSEFRYVCVCVRARIRTYILYAIVPEEGTKKREKNERKKECRIKYLHP